MIKMVKIHQAQIPMEIKVMIYKVINFTIKNIKKIV
jgi:hypothetical protein